MRIPALDYAAVVLCALLVLGTMGAPALAQPASLQPLAQVLRSDGTLDLGLGRNVTLDPSGFEMTIDDQGRPRFTPARAVKPSAPQAIEKWSPEYTFSGADNIVTALAVHNNELYIGGYFSAIGPVFANRIVKWDGYTWTPLGAGVDGNVHAILVTDTGIYIGGDFIYAGDLFCQRIAKWDGARFSPLGEGFNGKVRALAMANGTLYAGGEFTSSGSTTLNRIARWDGSAWNPVGAGCNAPVLAFAVNGSDLYVGGEFTFIGTTPVNRVGRWTGTSWFTLASGTNSVVRALAYSDGSLYAGGDFTTAGTTTVNYIARWNGAAWSALGSGADQRVTAIAADEGTIYAGGHFYNIGGVSALRLASWDGSAWSALGSGVNSFVYALTFNAGHLFVGGDFSAAGAVTANHLVGWNGHNYSSLHTGKGFNGNVYAIYMDEPNNIAYIGGSFTQGGGIAASNIIKYDGSTGIWSALGSGISGPVYAITKQGSDIFAGGRFNSASGISASNVARWNGASWSALGSGITNGAPGTGTVYALASNGIDSLVAGGEFNTAGGLTTPRVALWNGGAWKTIGLGMDNTVYTLAYESFMFYAGGKFKNTQGGGYFLNYAALWSGDRQAWYAMGTGVDSTVYVMKPGGAGVLYVGGNFTTADGLPARRLARWEGSLWDGAISTGANGRIRAIDVVGTKIFIGGDFSEAGGMPANRFAILDLSSDTWSAPGNGLDSTVYALGMGDLYLGGAFTAAGAKPSFHFAQWLENSFVFMQVKLFLQGAYDAGAHAMTTHLNTSGHIPLVSPYSDHRTVSTIPANVTDWVMVELRTTGGTVAGQKSFFLHKNGYLADDDGLTAQVIFEGVTDGSYYVIIYHRNHIAVMSANPVALTSGGAVLYDFTTSLSQSWEFDSAGRTCVELEPGVWGLWAGDINQDGVITTRDYVVWYDANFAGESGYCVSDIDLNGSPAASDYTLWNTNSQIDPRCQLP